METCFHVTDHEGRVWSTRDEFEWSEDFALVFKDGDEAQEEADRIGGLVSEFSRPASLKRKAA